MSIKPVLKGKGYTPSEEALISLAEKSFLNLWSYPNLYKKPGKELCDLLVIFDNYVLVFSDKTINFSDHANINVSWPRWYKAAIQKSSDQIKGAIRWIENFPDNLFLDAACTEKLPLPLPPIEKRRVIGIVVALGAKDKCLEHLKSKSGSLGIKPALLGENHYLPGSGFYEPFYIGDINPQGDFIHVFDDITLYAILNELNTIKDFVDYLQKKGDFLRSIPFNYADGEEDILALYLQNMNEREEHDFPKIFEGGKVPNGAYEEFIRSPAYLLKQDADKSSELWDALINTFTKQILAGDAFSISGQDHEFSDYEEAVRGMAAERRVYRRALGQAIHQAIEQGKDHPRFSRAIMPGPKDKERDTGYVFLTVAYPKDIELERGYDQYRETRAEILRAYCYGHYKRNRHLKGIIGIAMEPLNGRWRKEGTSEDLILLKGEHWTNEHDKETDVLCEKYDLLREGRVKEARLQIDEYPQIPPDTVMIFENGNRRTILIGDLSENAERPLNRRMRRARKSRRRK